MSTLAHAKALRTAGHDVQVLTVDDDYGGREVEGLPVKTIPGPNIYWNYFEKHSVPEKLIWHTLENFNPLAYRAMRQQLSQIAPDVLLTFNIENINVASWAAAKSMGIPCAHVVQSCYLLCWKSTMQRGNKNCEGQCASCRAVTIGRRLSSHLIDGVTAETDYVIKRHLDAGYFKNAMTRSVPGAIPQVFAKQPRTVSRDRPLRVGFIGMHIPYKGLDTLAEAAHKVNSALDVPKNRRIEFHIAGTGDTEYARSVPSKFPAANSFFPGWVDPNAFMPNLDLLVVPSYGNEPFGRVSIEAFSHGVPVLGSRSGGIPETITPDVDGQLFDRGNASELAALLKYLEADRAVLERWSAGALQKAERYLSTAVGSRFSSFLEDVVAKVDSRKMDRGDHFAEAAE